MAAGCFITLLWKEHEVNEYVMESRAVSSRCGGGGKYAGYFKSQTHEMCRHTNGEGKLLRCKILKVSFNNNKEQILSVFLSDKWGELLCLFLYSQSKKWVIKTQMKAMCSHSETLKISPLSVRDVWLPFQICQIIWQSCMFCNLKYEFTSFVF